MSVKGAGVEQVITSTGDDELDAMSFCIIALELVRPEAQARITGYLAARYDEATP